MTITDSRVRAGELTLDGDSYATQPTNVRITPSHDSDGDRIEVLDGSEIQPTYRRRNTLNIEAIQDFDNDAGLIALSWDQDMPPSRFPGLLTPSARPIPATSRSSPSRSAV
jgi:hypothetical protein